MQGSLTTVFPDTHRTLSLDYAGGPIFDLGPYIINPAMLALYHHPDNELTAPETVQGTMVKAHTGVDLTTTVAMTFPKIGAIAIGERRADTADSRHDQLWLQQLAEPPGHNHRYQGVGCVPFKLTLAKSSSTTACRA